MILNYAKGFIEDKLKRPSAEDLLDAEDVKLLPKVRPRVCHADVRMWVSMRYPELSGHASSAWSPILLMSSWCVGFTTGIERCCLLRS